MEVKKNRKPIKILEASAACIAFIAGMEGYNPKTHIPIPGDVPTICYGSTHHKDMSPIRPGEVMTKEQCVDLLEWETQKVQNEIKKCVDGIELDQSEFDMLVSFGFNLGSGAICNKSSSVYKNLKSGNIESACNALLQYNKISRRDLPMIFDDKTGKWRYKLEVIRGLDRRRKAENEICLNGWRTK